MMDTIQDKPLWKRSAFWTSLISLLTFVGLQFPDWDKHTKVAIQIVQFVMTLIVVDQATRSVDMKNLVGRGLMLYERNGDIIDQTTLVKPKPPTVEELQAQIEALKKQLNPPAPPPAP